VLPGSITAKAPDGMLEEVADDGKGEVKSEK
jgi:hypothetical protein